MPRTYTTEHTVYLYNELSDSAKARARDWWREASAGDTYYLDHVTEDAAEVLAALGFDIPKPRGRQSGHAIWWSLGYSQSDGCAFDATWRAEDCKPEKMLANRPAEFERDGKREKCKVNAELRALAARVVAIKEAGAQWAKISSSNRGNWTRVDELEFSDDTPTGADCDATEKEFGEVCRDIAAWIYDRLRDENDYQNSDEQVAETIIANEYEFTEEGERA